MVVEKMIKDSLLKWRCRRGMLELDLVFQRFLHTNLTSLSHDERNDLLSLLEEADQQLYTWLITKTDSDPTFHHLIEKIRTAS